MSALIGYTIGLALTILVCVSVDLPWWGESAAGLLLPVAGAVAGMAVKR